MEPRHRTCESCEKHDDGGPTELGSSPRIFHERPTDIVSGTLRGPEFVFKGLGPVEARAEDVPRCLPVVGRREEGSRRLEKKPRRRVVDMGWAHKAKMATRVGGGKIVTPLIQKPQKKIQGRDHA